MKIVMLESLGVSEEILMDYSKPYIEAGHEFVPCTKTLTDDEKKLRIEDADIAIIANGKLSGDIIRQGKKLRMISVGFTGIDHLDIEACKEKNLTICNAQGYATECTGEFAIGLMLAALRNIPAYDGKTRDGGTKEGLANNTLQGKTVGIVGTGAIGIYVAKLAQAFGAKVIGYNPRPKQEALEAGIIYKDLEALCKESDIISLHAPATRETLNLIDAEHISLMKKTAILINCARGPLVDSEALARALNEGRIAKAAIDVFETEPPLTKEHPLLQAKNCIVAPHVGYYTEESYEKRVKIVMDNIGAYIKGEPMNVKDLT